MPSYTPNYNLYKPNRNDTEEVDVTLTANFEAIDTDLKNKADKLNEHAAQLAEIVTLSVKKYEHLANGTDYTPAVQAAADALPLTGGVLLIPKMYRITSQINITGKENIVISASYKGGLFIDSATYCNFLYLKDCNDITVDNVTFDAVGHSENWTWADTNNKRVKGILAQNCDNLTVERCKFYRQNFQAIEFGGGDGLSVLNNYFEALGGNGISPDRYDSTGDGYTDVDYAKNIRIIGNEINGCYDSYVGMHDASYGVIMGNNFHDTAVTGYGIDMPGCSHITVTGNTVTGCHSGIKVHSRNKPYTHNVIKGNTIYGSDEAGISIEEGADFNVIEGNTIKGCRDGIYLYRVDGCSVGGNVITNNTRHGIFLDGLGAIGCNNNIIKGNIVTQNSNTGIKGDADSSSKHNLIHENFVLGNTVAQIAVSSYNHISDNPIKATTEPYNVSDLVSKMGMEATTAGYVHTMVGGLSAGSTKPNNFAGRTTLPAGQTTITVSFPRSETNSSYNIVFGVENGAVDGLRVANKTVNGFDFVVTTAPPFDRPINWILFRI